MDHPRDRSERRAVRNGKIVKRKHIHTKVMNTWKWSSGPNPIKGRGWEKEEDVIFGHLPIVWTVLTEDEKKLREVFAALDGKALPKDEDEKETQWGIYSKWTGTCGCHGCKYHRPDKERAKMRRVDVKEINRGLVDYQEVVEELELKKKEEVEFTLGMEEDLKISDDELDIFFHKNLRYDSTIRDTIFRF